jgi:hydrogenase maturation protease
MAALVIAIGNRLRADDGVAHRVVDLLAAKPNVTTRSVIQLTPEIAAEIAHYDVVVFADADARAEQLQIEPIGIAPAPLPLTHASHPSEVVALARTLFGFAGKACLCRIPANEFSASENLSAGANTAARKAAQTIAGLL